MQSAFQSLLGHTYLFGLVAHLDYNQRLDQIL